jgi:hypothetical protein
MHGARPTDRHHRRNVSSSTSIVGRGLVAVVERLN